MIDVQLTRPSDWAAVEAKWRALEPLTECSFFQSWTWMGCMAETRFPDPVLLEAFDTDRPVGLALFNRRRGRLYLGESGEAVLDGLTIEHNGILAARELGGEVRTACLRAARRASWGVVLSGIGQADQAAAQAVGSARTRIVRPTPFVDLAAIRAAGGTYRGTLSANTRHQINRSERRFAESGPLVLMRAQDADMAHAFLDALIGLHQAQWTAAGRLGAFSHKVVRAFHHALIDRGHNRGEIDLWKIFCEHAIVGYLYNFQYRNCALSYQSGLTADRSAHRKPGLVCHTLAIEAGLNQHLVAYDFLAGDHRYKASLATDSAKLYWTSLERRLAPGWWRWQLARVGQRLTNAASNAGQTRNA